MAESPSIVKYEGQVFYIIYHVNAVEQLTLV